MARFAVSLTRRARATIIYSVKRHNCILWLVISRMYATGRRVFTTIAFLSAEQQYVGFYTAVMLVMFVCYYGHQREAVQCH